MCNGKNWQNCIMSFHFSFLSQIWNVNPEDKYTSIIILEKGKIWFMENKSFHLLLYFLWAALILLNILYIFFITIYYLFFSFLQLPPPPQIELVLDKPHLMGVLRRPIVRIRRKYLTIYTMNLLGIFCLFVCLFCLERE